MSTSIRFRSKFSNTSARASTTSFELAGGRWVRSYSTVPTVSLVVGTSGGGAGVGGATMVVEGLLSVGAGGSSFFFFLPMLSPPSGIRSHERSVYGPGNPAKNPENGGKIWQVSGDEDLSADQ